MTSRPSPSAALAAVMLLLGGVALPARAEEGTGPNPYLSQAQQLYESLRYEQCLLRIQQAGQWKSTLPEMVRIEIYGGLCQFALGNTREAEAHFALAVRLDPQAQLPPLSSPKAVAAFERARSRAEAPSPTPETGSGDETADAPLLGADSPRNEGRGRPGALSPELEPVEPELPGGASASAGHAPSSRTVPMATWYLSGGSLVAGGGAVFFWTRAKDYERRANAEPFEAPAFALGNQARSQARLAYGSAAISVGLAATALWFYLRDPPAQQP